MKLSTAIASGLLCSALGSSMVCAAPTVDTLLGSAAMNNSGNDSELAALSREAGIDLGTKLYKMELAATPLASWVDGAWVINTGAYQPGYFLLKFGGGGKLRTDQTTYFFENIGDKNELVFSNSQVNFLSGGDCLVDKKNALSDSPCNIMRLSHYSFTSALIAATPPAAGIVSHSNPGATTGGGSDTTAGPAKPVIVADDTILAADKGSAAAAIPEPGTIALLVAGLLGLGYLRRRARPAPGADRA